METATRTAKTMMMMDILNTGSSNIIDIKATNKTRQVQTAWAGPVWLWLQTTAARPVSAAMNNANYRSWAVATITANFSEWFAVNYRGWNSRSGDGCDHQPLDYPLPEKNTTSGQDQCAP